MQDVKAPEENGTAQKTRRFGGSHMKGRVIEKRLPATSALPFFDKFKPTRPAPILPDGSRMEFNQHYPVRLLKEFSLGNTLSKKDRIAKIGSKHTVVRNFGNSVLLCKDEILCFKVNAQSGIDFEFIQNELEESSSSPEPEELDAPE